MTFSRHQDKLLSKSQQLWRHLEVPAVPRQANQELLATSFKKGRLWLQTRSQNLISKWSHFSTRIPNLFEVCNWKHSMLEYCSNVLFLSLFPAGWCLLSKLEALAQTSMFERYLYSMCIPFPWNFIFDVVQAFYLMLRLDLLQAF